jgi:hypothetical protein
MRQDSVPPLRTKGGAPEKRGGIPRRAGRKTGAPLARSAPRNDNVRLMGAESTHIGFLP